MFRIPFYLICLQVLISCAGNSQKPGDTTAHDVGMDSIFFNSEIRSRVEMLLDYPLDSLGFPRSMDSDGNVRKVSSSDWTSGFFPGSLFYIYELTGDCRFKNRAEEWLIYLEREKKNGKTHDMGFKINSSFGNSFRFSKNDLHKAIIVQSAATLISRYNPQVGAIKSWDFGTDKWAFPVIIDNMMNLELLFEATRLSGDSIYHKIAVSHARKTLKNHFREDNSSYHVIDYDPESGGVVQRLTHQGFSDESTWSRGQAWGLYGFTMAYRYSSDPDFLRQAIKIATFIIDHPRLPEDKIPYWDMDDPEIPDAPRDASAAAVMASAFMELSMHTKDDVYKDVSLDILKSLSSATYVLNPSLAGPFLLDHSTGNMPKSDELDVPINYAEYYFLEAISRLHLKKN